MLALEAGQKFTVEKTNMEWAEVPTETFQLFPVWESLANKMSEYYVGTLIKLSLNIFFKHKSLSHSRYIRDFNGTINDPDLYAVESPM